MVEIRRITVSRSTQPGQKVYKNSISTYKPGMAFCNPSLARRYK
jgi:hypothetical protein